MASANLVQELTCPICLELFTDPVSLECDHHFCRSCISQVWEKVPGQVSCPQCRRVFTQRNTRPVQILSNIAEQVRRLSLEVRAQEEEFVCPEHDEKLKLFCEEEQEMICVVCSLSQLHKTHCVLPIKEAVKAYKEKLENSLKLLQEQMDQSVETKREGEDVIRRLKDQVENVSCEYKAEFAKMHRFLREKEQQMEAELQREADKILVKLENNLKRTVDEMSSLEGVIKDLKVRLEMQDPSRLLKDIQALLKRCEVQVCSPGVGSADLPVDTADARLRYLKVWKELRAVVPPVLEPLTLDPDTAQNNLIVSQDRRSVQWTTTSQNYPQHSKRFERLLCVLTSQSFTSGRHYWEVNVGNKMGWAVGVCRESVQRKGRSTSSTEEGYWVIGLISDYTLMNVPNIISPLKIKPQKLGVYLDYEGGKVSFYNADSLCHLYTFTDRFTEKLYPIFNPCNNETGNNLEPLTLLTG